jgi:hypothetical protein
MGVSNAKEDARQERSKDEMMQMRSTQKVTIERDFRVPQLHTSFTPIYNSNS